MHLIKKIVIFAIVIAMASSICLFSGAEPTYSASKVTSVEITNVGDLFTIKKGKKFKLRCSVDAVSKRYKKVVWKSSNKKVVKVSKKGVIRTRKKGTAYITVFAKHNKKIRDRVKIRVGYPVKRIKFKESVYYVDPEGTLKLSCKVRPKKATYKKLNWTSSDPEVAAVSQEGVVTGLKPGTVTITAKSTDGRNRRASTSLKVAYIKKGDALFVAHRGFSSIAPENTLPAFEQAAVNDFDAAEMDVWESQREDGDIDIMVMHDATIERMCGADVPSSSVNRENREDYPVISGNNIEEYTRDGNVVLIPTLEEVLETLRSTNPDTMPVIEIKTKALSKRAAAKILGSIERYGSRATIISFHRESLETIQNEIEKRGLEDMVETSFLTSKPTKAKIKYCAARGYTGVSMKREALTKKLVEYAQSKGLFVATWGISTQADAARVIDWGVVRLTSNYKLFNDR